MIRCLAIIGVIVSSAVAFAQPKLTKDLGEKVSTGAGSLTEQEVLKLVPGPVSMTRLSKGGQGGVDADWLLRWEEATKFEVVLIDGKVSLLNGTAASESSGNLERRCFAQSPS